MYAGAFVAVMRTGPRNVTPSPPFSTPAQRQLAYLDDHRECEPAVRRLITMFGEPFAQGFLRTVMFPIVLPS